MNFAIRMVDLYKYLLSNFNEYVLSKQLVRCGTSIGANIREAEQAESTADFIHKLSISLKESNETSYWLELLFQTKYINEKEFQSLETDLIELKKLLISIIKTTKQNNKK